MKKLTCSFTGHRIIANAHKDMILYRLDATIDALIEKGYVDFCSGGAMGFDLVAADMVLKKREAGKNCRLVMVLPCRNQTKGWSAAMVREYERILSLADEVIYVSEEYYDGCMQARNRRLVDDADVVVAYITKSFGGTAYTVKYAEKSEKKIINLAKEA